MRLNSRITATALALLLAFMLTSSALADTAKARSGKAKTIMVPKTATAKKHVAKKHHRRAKTAANTTAKVAKKATKKHGKVAKAKKPGRTVAKVDRSLYVTPTPVGGQTTVQSVPVGQTQTVAQPTRAAQAEKRELGTLTAAVGGKNVTVTVTSDEAAKLARKHRRPRKPALAVTDIAGLPASITVSDDNRHRMNFDVATNTPTKLKRRQLVEVNGAGNVTAYLQGDELVYHRNQAAAGDGSGTITIKPLKGSGDPIYLPVVTKADPNLILKPAPAPAVFELPGWLLPLLIAIAILLLVILALAVAIWRRRFECLYRPARVGGPSGSEPIRPGGWRPGEEFKPKKESAFAEAGPGFRTPNLGRPVRVSDPIGGSDEEVARRVEEANELAARSRHERPRAETFEEKIERMREQPDVIEVDDTPLDQETLGKLGLNNLSYNEARDASGKTRDDRARDFAQWQTEQLAGGQVNTPAAEEIPSQDRSDAQEASATTGEVGDQTPQKVEDAELVSRPASPHPSVVLPGPGSKLSELLAKDNKEAGVGNKPATDKTES